MTADEIKDQIDIVDVVKEYKNINLKRVGSEWKGMCPYHNEKSPSFTLFDQKFKCFGCGKSGDVFAFYGDMEKKTFLESVTALAARYNLEFDRKVKEYTRPVERLEKLGKRLLDWFEKERGIENNTLLRFKVTEAKEWMPPPHNKDVTCVCFNYYRDDVLVNIKFRGPQKSFKLAKDAELIFYNLDAIKGTDEAVIVEGEPDCLTVHQCGRHDVVSVPNGAGTGNLSLPYLDNCWKYFEGKSKIILFVDNDEPGFRLRDELARRLGYERCWIAEVPDGIKDANSLMLEKGAVAVLEAINNAKPWPIEGILKADDVMDQVVEFFTKGYPKGDRAGIPGFDDKFQFVGGQLTMVTGIPGAGKSEFVDLIMANMAKIHGWPWGVISFETPVPIHVTKLQEKMTGKAFDYRNNPAHRMTMEEFEWSFFEVDRKFHFVNIDELNASIDGILEKLTLLVKKFGIKGAVIDPWNYIEQAIPPGVSETQYINEVLTKIIRWAKMNQVHIFIIAHPTKLKKEGNKYEVPTLYSISGSAHFFNKTHNGFAIWRDFGSNEVVVHIQKIKFSWLGSLGQVHFQYNTMTRQYQEQEPEGTVAKNDWLNLN